MDDIAAEENVFTFRFGERKNEKTFFSPLLS